MKPAILIFCVILFAYLTFGFVLWDFNPANWSYISRFNLAWLSIGCSTFLLCVYKGIR